MQISTFEKLYTTDIDVAKLYAGTNEQDEDLIFYIKEIGNKHHEKLTRKMSKQLERARTNHKRNHALMSEILAKTILVDWTGVVDENGDPVEATIENKKNALIKYKSLFREIVDFAGDANNFRAEENGEDLDDDEELNAEQATEKN